MHICLVFTDNNVCVYAKELKHSHQSSCLLMVNVHPSSHCLVSQSQPIAWLRFCASSWFTLTYQRVRSVTSALSACPHERETQHLPCTQLGPEKVTITSLFLLCICILYVRQQLSTCKMTTLRSAVKLTLLLYICTWRSSSTDDFEVLPLC